MENHVMKLLAHSFCADVSSQRMFGALQLLSHQSGGDFDALCASALSDTPPPPPKFTGSATSWLSCCSS